MNNLDQSAIENFQRYLQIPSVHPDPDYTECVTFIKEQAATLDLPCCVYEYVEGKPVVVLTWEGSKPGEKSILLNSHMDVVPVDEALWDHPPFSGYIDESGDIYGRGSQDMKSVTIQYLEAIRRLKNENVTPQRTVHLSFVPDEEIGGITGMRKFLESQEFKDLNVGFALDEGMASESDTFWAYYGERTIWEFTVKCNGTAGHGSLLLKNTAGEKLRFVIDKFMDRRQQEADKLESDPSLTTGDVTTINLTILEGGLQVNVVPSSLTATFDTRIAIDVDLDQFEAEIRSWLAEAGDDIELDFILKNPKIPFTPIDDSNIYWTSLKTAFEELNLNYRTAIFNGGTDSNYLRQIGIPAIGFSPMNNTPVLLHDNNERLNQEVFLRGIEIYTHIIPSLSAA